MKTNAIYCGDCKDVLINHIPDESVDLIYCDPPFFTGKNYEIIWGDGYEVRAFEDRRKGGVMNYITWMEDKMRECHRVLKPTGSMYLHCDWHANAHLRILMDGIFGENNFQNEIIWCYRTGGATKKRFSRKHDTILFYTKSPKYKFNCIKERVYYDKPFFSPKIDKQGRYYADVLPVDFWEIPAVINVSKERLDYPTQKPELLLEKIIKASSDPTDIVLDPMCGCGTATAVAHKLGRRWIGIDVSPTACKLMVKRMQKLRVKISDDDILGLPKTIKQVRGLQPFEFQNWVCEKLHARVSKKKVGDMGIDGWWMGFPLQVKQSEHVGRNVIDNFETALRRKGKDRGIIVAFSFGKGAYEEVARVKLKGGLDIELKTVKEMLGEE